MKEGHLNIHGIKITVQSDLSRVIEDLEHDFSYFHQLAVSPDCLRILVKNAASRPTKWRLLLKTSRSRLFFPSRGEQRVCFFDRAWVSYHFANKRSEIYCDDPALAYEMCYFVVLSYLGESLDRRGVHRIHGLGLVHKRIGAIVMAPSGGGKSTLAMELLMGKDIDIVSDDTPLLREAATLRQWATMVAFPQRIALTERPRIGSRFLRKFTRAKHGEKYVVGCEYFRDRVCPEAPVHWLVLITNKKAALATLTMSHKVHALWPIFKWHVIGYETPQIWELYLRWNARDLFSKTTIFCARLKSAWRLLRSVRVARLTLSSDPKESSRVLRSFLVQAKT